MSDYLAPIGAVLLPWTGGILGTLVMKSQSRPGKGNTAWSQSLNKSKLQPPNWVFGPVWGCLYGSMGYASYMIWRDGGGFAGKAAVPLACYGTQLAINWAWAPTFFKYHKLGLSCVENGAMLLGIAATMATAYEINPNATYLLAPYLAWVSLASYLSFYIWRNNKDRID